MMSDQLTMFLRGVQNAPTDPNGDRRQPRSCRAWASPMPSNNMMATFPTAYVIPWGAGQRSDAAANGLVQYCLTNGIQVQRMTSDFAWNGTTFQAGSYVVSMSQALRGLAWNVFDPGVDIRTARSPSSTPAGRLEPRPAVGRRHCEDAAR